jgi:hypothetical protein
VLFHIPSKSNENRDFGVVENASDFLFTKTEENGPICKWAGKSVQLK